MESPLLAQAGAVPAHGPDAGVAAHYGDPFAEQRALARSAGMVDRSHHGVLRIAGEDRLSWLNSLTTQDTEHLAPGEVTQALVLSPNGHVEHHLTLTDDGTAVWIHIEPGTAEPLLAFLQSMRFMLRVDPVDVTGEFALLTLKGPDAAGVLPDEAAVTMADSFGMDVIVPRDRSGRLRGAADRRAPAAARAGHRSPDHPA
jgi:folate-binding Fe-S cluster repair protein YgfZ